VVKVCCIQDEAELRLAAGAGARFVGLVSAMPSGPGPIPDGHIRRLAAVAPAGVTPVLLTARADEAGIVDHVRDTGVRGVQLVRAVPEEVRRRVRAALPGVTVIQVVHVEGPASVAEALSAAEGADHLLLDSGRPGASVPELGGTGRTHDWGVSAEIVRRAPVPVLLAGGLGPDNVAGAVKTVRPWGVDVCSGLRDGSGRLVSGRVEAFFAAVQPVDGV
jgi:phosphoribosylanthranilate isomerase